MKEVGFSRRHPPGADWQCGAWMTTNLLEGGREDVMRRCAVTQWLALIAAAAHLILLAGCNTIHGVGEDVEAAGDALQDAAD